MEDQNDIVRQTSLGQNKDGNGEKVHQELHEVRSTCSRLDPIIGANHPLTQSESLVARARIIDLIENFELLQASNPEDERAFDSDTHSDFQSNSESDESDFQSDSESNDESDFESDSESDGESDFESDSESDESDFQSDSESDDGRYFGTNSDNRMSSRRVFLHTCVGVLIVIPFLLDAMILLGDLTLMAPSLNLYCVIHVLAAICAFSVPRIFKPFRGRKTPNGWKFILCCVLMVIVGAWLVIKGDPNPERGRGAAVVYGIVLGLIMGA